MKSYIRCERANSFCLVAVAASMLLAGWDANKPAWAQTPTSAPVTVPATDMRLSEEAYARGDHVLIYGIEKVKTYVFYATAKLPFGKFKLQVEAAGVSGDGRWPKLGLALDDTGKIIKELTIDHTDFRAYDFGAIDATAASTIYLVFTNDYYNAATNADVNLKIRQASFTPAVTVLIQPSPIDTFVVKGKSATLAWNANHEQDLAGYRIFQGLESGKYLSPIEAGKDTSMKVELSPHFRYYFALAAYDRDKNQSPLSREVVVLVEEGGASGGASSGDLNGDGKCDAADRTILDRAFGSSCNHRRYNRQADLNLDCKVDGLDLVLFSANCR